MIWSSYWIENPDMRSSELSTWKSIINIYANYYTKSSGWDIKIWKKNLTSYLSQNSLIFLKLYLTFISLILTNLMLWQPLTKMVNSSLSSLIVKNLIGIIRELNKEFLMYSYTIYITSTWSVLMINSFILISIHCL